MDLSSIHAEELANGDAQAIGPLASTLGEDANEGPVRVSTRMPGPGVDLFVAQGVKAEDDLDVGEALKTRNGLDAEAFVELDARRLFVPAIVASRAPPATNVPDRFDSFFHVFHPNYVLGQVKLSTVDARSPGDKGKAAHDRNMTDSLTIKVLADHREDGTPFYELLQMKPEAEGFRLIYSPAFVQGTAAGDLVSVDEGGALHVLERGGNLCIQVMTLKPNPEFAAALAEAMHRLGALQDGFGPSVYVFSAPVSIGFAPLEAELARVVSPVADAEWLWGNVYDPRDGETPLNWW